MVVVGASHGTTSEYHSIFRQRASLIAENVLNLSQLFRNIHRSTFSALVRLRIVEIEAVVNNKNLEDFTHFNSDIKSKRNQNLKSEKVKAQVQFVVKALLPEGL